MNCFRCEDVGWVCEAHPDRPWEGANACRCRAGGAPCPGCNVPADGKPPRPPTGFSIKFDKDGWRH